jgi:hypothetical protein
MAKESGMTISDLRREAQARLKRLPAEDVPIANAFLAFLEKGSTEALPVDTAEIVQNFKRSWQQAQSGQVKPVSQLKWN